MACNIILEWDRISQQKCDHCDSWQSPSGGFSRSVGFPGHLWIVGLNMIPKNELVMVNVKDCDGFMMVYSLFQAKMGL